MTSKEIQLEDLMFEYPLDRESLQQQIPKYREFSELKLTPSEVPVYGKPFKHQEFLVKFMQIVDSVLLMDATGSGKTGSFQHTSEYFRDHPEFGINKVFMITKNIQLVEWMKESLVSVTNPLGYPEFSKPASGKSQMGRKKKLTQHLSEIGTLSNGETRTTPYRMHFSTYATFVNRFHNLGNEELVEHFSGSLIVIDEVHRILPKYITEDIVKKYAVSRTSPDFVSGQAKFADARSINDIYLFVHWLIQHVPRMKKILSSATPIINQLTRIQALINILRIDRQFYMDKYQWNQIGDTPEGIEMLKNMFRGYVAYTREFDNNVMFDEKGTLINVGGDVFTMENLQMVPGGVQERKYNSSSCGTSIDDVEREIVEGSPGQIDPDSTDVKTSGLCISQRQISMFVYPDGALDDEQGRWTQNETKLFRHISEKAQHVKKAGAKKIVYRAAKQVFVKILQDMDKLKELSVRFWFIIKGLKEEDILRQQRTMASRSWFIFMLYVNNAIDILGMALKAHGYKQFYMRDGTNDPSYHYRRFAIITAKTDSAEKTAILSKKNSPDNYDGKLLRLVIGSSAVMEGISFHSVTAFGADTQWTDGEEYQAQRRILRATSHIDMTNMMYRSVPSLNALVDSRGRDGYRMLMARHGVPTKISIATYLYNSYPSQLDPSQTIEARVQASSRKVGRKVGKITRALKEVSVNCNLNELRNRHRQDRPNTRNCDYMSCQYTCDKTVPEDMIGINLNNYKILNMESNILSIIDVIGRMLIEKALLTIQEIEERLKTLRLNEFLLNAVERILASNISTTNRFGDQGYIRIIGDIVFFSKDYKRHNSLPSTWTSNGLNIRTNIDPEQWLLLSVKTDKNDRYRRWILTNKGDSLPEDVKDDLSTMSLTAYFELLVDIYYRMIDNVDAFTDIEKSMITHKYLSMMARMNYHYAGADSRLREIVFSKNIKRFDRYLLHFFHAITTFMRKGSIRYASGENDIGNIKDNMRFYDRTTHTWSYISNHVFRFVSILRTKRMKTMRYFVSIAPFVRIVIPDNVVKYVKKKRRKEKRLYHGIVCKENAEVDDWSRSLGYRGPEDRSCATLVAVARAAGKLVYT